MKRRRQRGEGALYQRSDRLWTGRFYYLDELGRRKRATVVAKTMAKARERMQTLRAQVAAGLQPAIARNVTMTAFLDRWIEDVVKLKRPATYRQYKSIAKTHLKSDLGHIQITDLTPANVQALITQLSGKEISQRTAQLSIVILRAALKQAMRWQMVARNVADLVDKPSVDRKEMLFLSAEQVAAFLEVAAADPLYAMYLLAIFCGLREGEILALDWSRVDLKAAELRVEYTLDPADLELAPVKTARSRRTVEIPAFVVAELKRHHQRMLAKGHPHGLLFVGKDGKAVRISNVLRRGFKPLLEAAKLPAIRFHDLRHTAVYLMRLAGVDWMVISRRLGHASTAFTMDTYGHLDAAMQRGAAIALDQFFGQKIQ